MERGTHREIQGSIGVSFVEMWMEKSQSERLDWLETETGGNEKRHFFSSLPCSVSTWLPGQRH